MGKAHGYFFLLSNILCCSSKPKSCHRGVELQRALAVSANGLWGPVRGNLVKSPHLVVTGLSGYILSQCMIVLWVQPTWNILSVPKQRLNAVSPQSD